MTIGIIGAGKVGTTLGKYLCKNRIAVSGYYSRTYEHSVSAADFTETKAYYEIQSIVDASDTLFIATPDREIAHVWDCIANYKLEGKVICHFSGSLSSYVFSGIEITGAVGCSIHPMFAFSDKYKSYETFSTAYITMEGQEEAVQKMRWLFEGLGHKVCLVRAEDKMKYHAAAALASNYMIGLFQTSLNLLSECSFSEEDGRGLLGPLIRNNVNAMLEYPTAEVLTGPIERNDIRTVQEHLKVLQGTNAEDIYRCIGKELIMIAKQKNSNQNYSMLNRLFREENAETKRGGMK